MMHLQKITFLKEMNNLRIFNIVPRKKCSQNTQPRNEILRSSGTLPSTNSLWRWIVTSIACYSEFDLEGGRCQSYSVVVLTFWSMFIKD